jgi:hypothetical protein
MSGIQSGSEDLCSISLCNFYHNTMSEEAGVLMSERVGFAIDRCIFQNNTNEIYLRETEVDFGFEITNCVFSQDLRNASYYSKTTHNLFWTETASIYISHFGTGLCPAATFEVTKTHQFSASAQATVSQDHANSAAFPSSDSHAESIRFLVSNSVLNSERFPASVAFGILTDWFSSSHFFKVSASLLSSIAFGPTSKVCHSSDISNSDPIAATGAFAVGNSDLFFPSSQASSVHFASSVAVLASRVVLPSTGHSLTDSFDPISHIHENSAALSKTDSQVESMPFSGSNAVARSGLFPVSVVLTVSELSLLADFISASDLFRISGSLISSISFGLTWMVAHSRDLFRSDSIARTSGFASSAAIVASDPLFPSAFLNFTRTFGSVSFCLSAASGSDSENSHSHSPVHVTLDSYPSSISESPVSESDGTWHANSNAVSDFASPPSASDSDSSGSYPVSGISSLPSSQSSNSHALSHASDIPGSMVSSLSESTDSSLTIVPFSSTEVTETDSSAVSVSSRSPSSVFSESQSRAASCAARTVSLVHAPTSPVFNQTGLLQSSQPFISSGGFSQSKQFSAAPAITAAQSNPDVRLTRSSGGNAAAMIAATVGLLAVIGAAIAVWLIVVRRKGISESEISDDEGASRIALTTTMGWDDGENFEHDFENPMDVGDDWLGSDDAFAERNCEEGHPK